VYSTSRGLFRWPLRWVQNDVLELGPKETLRINGSYESLALDAAGQSLAVAQFDGEIQLRKPEGPWGTIPQKAGGLRLAFSPDGRWLVGGSFNLDWLRVWDTASGQMFREFQMAKGVAPGFAPQGRLFAVTSTELVFWNLGTGEREAALPRDYVGTLRGLAVCSADGQFMAFSRSRTRVDLLYLPTLEVVASFDALDNVAEAIALDEHGTELIIGKDRQFFDRWDLRALRAELAKLNLDWNLPPLPPADPAASKPLRVVVKDQETAR
jgi:WD40 repeat protein